MKTKLQRQSTTHNSLCFRGTEYKAFKHFWQGTHRTISPQETLDRIRPYFKQCGITRLSNVTGLDRIGIHTTLAIRPNSPTLSVCSGKGITLSSALASGAMEAIELYHSENAALASFSSSFDELENRCNSIPIDRLALTPNSLFNSKWPYLWSKGWNIVDQTEVAVPTAVVEMNAKSGGCHLGAFQVSSNGLASGNEFCEAIAYALFELIERDAITCHKLAWERYGRQPDRIKLETIEYPLVLGLLDKLKNAGVQPVLYDCMVDTKVPVYMAYLYDTLTRNIGIFGGYGAHMDPEIAMVRAITEAVQSRGVYISGSRDDVFPHQFYRIRQYDTRAALNAINVPATADASAHSSEATTTFHGDVHLAVSKLAAVGLDKVIVFDLRINEIESPVHVVKVVVPGLEGSMNDLYSPGSRALRYCEEPKL